MEKKRLNVNWRRGDDAKDFMPSLKRFRHFLEDEGLRESTICSYVFRVGKYLEFAASDTPSVEDFKMYQGSIQKLSRSSINNYCFAIKKYHEMLGQKVNFTFIKPKNTIPYYFDESDIAKVFSVCYNLKHLAMLQTLFYGCLRASELCSLDESDLDLKALTLRVEGKGGKEALVYITDECAKTLRHYLEVRPQLEFNNRKPLFYTDFGGRFDRRDIHRIFIHYKKLAGIQKHGGVHVFSRHSVGSLLVKRGCDIVTIKELMRHSDIQTTMRYLHISDSVKRMKYETFLTL
jgi:site-specific recombinase XerD